MGLAKKEHERMQSEFVAAFTRKLEAAGYNLDDFRGCSADEIEAAMTAQGVSFLPAMYVEFLKLIGQDSPHDFVWDKEWEYRHLLAMKEIALDRLQVNGTPSLLLHDAFVLNSYEDYMFLFFRTQPRDENPPVYFYADGELKTLQKSLLELLLGFMDGYEIQKR